MIKKHLLPLPNGTTGQPRFANQRPANQRPTLARPQVASPARLLNDVQSQLNLTRVRQVFQPTSVDGIARVIRTANRSNLALSVAGGRHSMGGQQFGSDNLHLDLSAFNRVLHLDQVNGLVTVQAGIQWPELIAELHRLQPASEFAARQPWTIREKQTGVDTVTIGGSLSANIHGRGLKSPPFVSDIESFQLLDGHGRLHHCSRNDNCELFSLAIGGYGLFGIVTQVTLRLVRRFKVKRIVKRLAVRNLIEHLNDQLNAGCVFGDCQYAIDLSGPPHNHPGIMPCYQPVDLADSISRSPIALDPDDWASLYQLTRTDKQRAFEIYAEHYLRTDGQIYWSDTHQLSGSFSGHRTAVDPQSGTEMITEVYLEYDRVMDFLSAVRAELAERKADLTYGTIRFIEPDKETFLPWARSKMVCIVVNLHVRRTPAGIQKAKQDFRAILDHALKHDGSFYLTYHRWALPQHVITAYPQIGEFFRLKLKYDPCERFQSEWYRHYVRYCGRS